MMNRVINILKNTSGISDWRVLSTRTESTELFFVHKNLETVRSTDTNDIKVTVYVSHDEKLGEATFSVYSSYDDEKIAEEIEKAKKKANIIANQSYSIPENEQGEYVSASNFANYKPHELASLISNACFEADCVEGGSINALEIFVYKDIVSVKNSRGIDKTQVKYRAMVEAIPTFNGEESVELYEQYNFTEFDHNLVREEIANKMREVKDRYEAKVPENKLSCPVVLDAPELDQLFGNYIGNLNFSMVYQHSNAFSIGDDIQKDAKGDSLTLTMCGEVKGSVSSSAFDADGITLVNRKIIENGKAIALYGGTRFAQYLGEKATGNLGCISVECGTLTDEAKKSAPYFRCASMSGLQVDIYNDYIGGEVRLGYYFDGEKEIPVTGISISGKLSVALANMHLSDKAVTYESYHGPKCAIFDGIEIV
jgi:predicted Zn-dependent protease